MERMGFNLVQGRSGRATEEPIHSGRTLCHSTGKTVPTNQKTTNQKTTHRETTDKKTTKEQNSASERKSNATQQKHPESRGGLQGVVIFASRSLPQARMTPVPIIMAAMTMPLMRGITAAATGVCSAPTVQADIGWEVCEAMANLDDCGLGCL
jgi:hypothetical protein